MAQEIKGVALGDLTEELKRVPAHLNSNPVKSFNLLERLGPEVIAYMQDYYSGAFDQQIRNLSMEVLDKRLTVDEICKVRYSSFIMMSSSVEEAFKEDPRFNLIRKIESSMWRWGVSRKQWNTVVDAYDSIRRFNVPIEGFEVRLDYTTGYNHCGYSEHSRTFLDGVFAYLLYYKGEHVMTLGFSIMKGKRLLVQQIQLAKRKGNRFLFKLPKGRMEFFLGQFREAFSGFRIHLVDGEQIANKSLGSYRQGLEETKSLIAKYTTLITRSGGDHDWETRRLAECGEEVKMFEDKIAHLSDEVSRIAAQYADLGQFIRGKTLKVNGLVHYELMC